MDSPVVCLDWRKHKTGQLKACRLCGADALLRDETNRPCHKVCAEQEIAQKAARAAATKGRAA